MTGRNLRHHDERFGLEFRPHPHRADIVDVTRVADGRQVDQIRLGAEVTGNDELAELAERWVRRRLGAEPPAATLCAGCGNELHPVTNHDTDHQFRGALRVTFSGGYGMFIDPDASDPTALICAGCATALADTAPWVATLLERGA
jgi:hypothetical protein